jgi:hypothetical protein
MFNTSHIASYAGLAAAINASFCDRHGYHFSHYQYDNIFLSPPHEMVRILSRELHSADWLMWLDSDACFIDFEQRLEELCDSNKHLIIAGHKFGFDPQGQRIEYRVNGLRAGLNTGVLLLRSSLWSRLFLDAWWRRCVMGAGQNTAYYEQGELQAMLMANEMDLQNQIHLVQPCSRLNRCDDDGRDICDFVLHLWGLDSKTREHALRQVASGHRPDIGIEMPSFHVPAFLQSHSFD